MDKRESAHISSSEPEHNENSMDCIQKKKMSRQQWVCVIYTLGKLEAEVYRNKPVHSKSQK
jgi:hypothetical protein